MASQPEAATSKGRIVRFGEPHSRAPGDAHIPTRDASPAAVSRALPSAARS